MVRSYITFAIKRFLAHALLTANRFAYSPKILVPNISLATPKGKAFLQCDFIFVYTQLNHSTFCSGASGRTRTDNFRFTRAVLYPVELQKHRGSFNFSKTANFELNHLHPSRRVRSLHSCSVDTSFNISTTSP